MNSSEIIECYFVYLFIMPVIKVVNGAELRKLNDKSLLEGGFLANSIYRIMPADSTFILLNVSISFVIFIFATYYRIPLSLTMRASIR